MLVSPARPRVTKSFCAAFFKKRPLTCLKDFVDQVLADTEPGAHGDRPAKAGIHDLAQNAALLLRVTAIILRRVGHGLLGVRHLRLHGLLIAPGTLRRHPILVFHEIMQGLHPEIAVEFLEQSSLPISFFLRGDLVNLAESEGSLKQIEIKQTFYARYVQEELLLSSDLTDWKPFLEFITGNVSVTLSIQDGHPSLIVGAETSRRP